MEGLRLMLFVYLAIGTYFYIAINFGRINLDIQSKQTGEYLEKDTKKYEILKLLFCIGWIVMAIQTIKRRGDNNGDD